MIITQESPCTSRPTLPGSSHNLIPGCLVREAWLRCPFCFDVIRQLLCGTEGPPENTFNIPGHRFDGEIVW